MGYEYFVNFQSYQPPTVQVTIRQSFGLSVHLDIMPLFGLNHMSVKSNNYTLVVIGRPFWTRERVCPL